MRLSLLFQVIFLLLAAFPSYADQAQFDFLIGQHEVTLHAWTGTGWTPPRPVNARWNGKRGLDDLAIYDEWFDPHQGSKGVNVRIFDPEENLWKMMWISAPAYQVQDLRAKERDGVMTMWQVHPERSGWHAEFEQLGPCRWARVDFQEDASGVPQPRFRLVATRAACEP